MKIIICSTYVEPQFGASYSQYNLSLDFQSCDVCRHRINRSASSRLALVEKINLLHPRLRSLGMCNNVLKTVIDVVWSISQDRVVLLKDDSFGGYLVIESDRLPI